MPFRARGKTPFGEQVHRTSGRRTSRHRTTDVGMTSVGSSAVRAIGRELGRATHAGFARRHVRWRRTKKAPTPSGARQDKSTMLHCLTTVLRAERATAEERQTHTPSSLIRLSAAASDCSTQHKVSQKCSPLSEPRHMCEPGARSSGRGSSGVSIRLVEFKTPHERSGLLRVIPDLRILGELLNSTPLA
jgi:hypothetical protein